MHGGLPGHLASGTTLDPLEPAGTRVPQSMRLPGPPLPSLGKKPPMHWHCPLEQSPRRLQGANSAVPLCCVATNSVGAPPSESARVPGAALSSRASPFDSVKVTSATLPASHTRLPAPKVNTTLDRRPGKKLLRRASTLSPGAPPLPASARGLSSATPATAVPSTDTDRAPHASVNAPTLQGPLGHWHESACTAGTAGTSGSAPTGQRGVEQSGPDHPASQTQPITRSASQAA